MGVLVSIEALIIRIGFWGILYYNCSKEPLTQDRSFITAL